MPEEKSSKKIFLDKRKLSTRYVPANLPHRDKQLQELDNFFRDSLADPSKDSRRSRSSAQQAPERLRR